MNYTVCYSGMNIAVRKREINYFKVKIVHFVISSHDTTLWMYLDTIIVTKIIIMVAGPTLHQQQLLNPQNPEYQYISYYCQLPVLNAKQLSSLFRSICGWVNPPSLGMNIVTLHALNAWQSRLPRYFAYAFYPATMFHARYSPPAFYTLVAEFLEARGLESTHYDARNGIRSRDHLVAAFCNLTSMA